MARTHTAPRSAGEAAISLPPRPSGVAFRCSGCARPHRLNPPARGRSETQAVRCAGCAEIRFVAFTQTADAGAVLAWIAEDVTVG